MRASKYKGDAFQEENKQGATASHSCTSWHNSGRGGCHHQSLIIKLVPFHCNALVRSAPPDTTLEEEVAIINPHLYSSNLSLPLQCIGQECTTPSTMADSGPDESSEQVLIIVIIIITIIIIITTFIIILITIIIWLMQYLLCNLGFEWVYWWEMGRFYRVLRCFLTRHIWFKICTCMCSKQIEARLPIYINLSNSWREREVNHSTGGGNIDK